MLSCKLLVAHSSEFLDGQLGLGQRMSVRMHLAMCRHCRRFIKQVRLSQAVLRKLPPGQSAELDTLAAKLAELRRQER
jgi:predicted anti-sigma-YlaC factor YlaD